MPGCADEIRQNSIEDIAKIPIFRPQPEGAMPWCGRDRIVERVRARKQPGRTFRQALDGQRGCGESIDPARFYPAGSCSGIGIDHDLVIRHTRRPRLIAFDRATDDAKPHGGVGDDIVISVQIFRIARPHQKAGAKPITRFGKEDLAATFGQYIHAGRDHIEPVGQQIANQQPELGFDRLNPGDTQSGKDLPGNFRRLAGYLAIGFAKGKRKLVGVADANLPGALN